MIEIGKDYIFRYKVNAEGTTSDENKICIAHDGLTVTVLEEKHEDKHGQIYEVEGVLGHTFFAYERELIEMFECVLEGKDEV